ncbi:MAG TPA: hypothetical protein DCW68_06440 [Rhodospirillaceae bacterium]|nr:MAG: hypothetical protein A2018_03785 [Alphaproteobacteria bacterium GWF2_58_20]HAU29727.1 hypothetical protein [Rhodospirillaceae bacterium]
MNNVRNESVEHNPVRGSHPIRKPDAMPCGPGDEVREATALEAILTFGVCALWAACSARDPGCCSVLLSEITHYVRALASYVGDTLPSWERTATLRKGELLGAHRMMSLRAGAGDVDGVRYWLDRGYSPSGLERGAVAPLRLAVSGGDVAMVELLLAHGADPDVEEMRVPVVEVARSKGDAQVYKLLRLAGAKNGNAWMPLPSPELENTPKFR